MSFYPLSTQQGCLLDHGPLPCYTAAELHASSPRTIPFSLVDSLEPIRIALAFALVSSNGLPVLCCVRQRDTAKQATGVDSTVARTFVRLGFGSDLVMQGSYKGKSQY